MSAPAFVVDFITEIQLKAFLFFLFSFLAFAPTFAQAQVPEDIQKHPVCKYCEMNRQHFAHGRMLVTYDDESAFGACSLHCAAIDLAISTDKSLVSIEVADYNSHELMDAEGAYWVIGGNKPGVMTRRAKWAFRKKKDAEAFIIRNGGVPATFDEAIEAACKDMYEDSKIIRGRRKIKGMHRNMSQCIHPASSCEQGNKR